MIIKRITIGNFKNVAQTTLDCSRMVALISVNNYGKSNLLEAIRFGLDFISASPKERNARMRQTKNIPLSPGLAGQDFIFSIEFDEPALGEYRFVRYSYRFSWHNDQGTGAKITDETIEMRPAESTKYTSYLKRAENKYRPGKSTTAFRQMTLPENALAADVIGMLEDAEIASVIQRIKTVGCLLCNSLELDDSFSPIPIEFDFGEGSSFGNEDIPRMLAMLKKKNAGLYDLFIETICDLFPEFTQIGLQTLTLKNEYVSVQHAYFSAETKAAEGEDAKVEDAKGEDAKEKNRTDIPYHLRDDMYRLMIKSKYVNQPIGMERMSTGTKRIFWLIANAVVSEYKKINLLGVDEIETSIHPRMIRNLLEALTEILGNTSMIVTSHSPYLIQYLKPESIYIGVPNDEGIARFRRIQPKKVKTLLNTTRRMEMSVGEYLFELMSGDTDAAEILSSYLEDMG